MVRARVIFLAAGVLLGFAFGERANADTGRQGRPMLKSPLERLSPKNRFVTDFFPETVQELPNEEQAAMGQSPAPEEAIAKAAPAKSKTSESTKTETVKPETAQAAEERAELERAEAQRSTDPLNEKTQGPFYVGKFNKELALPPDQVPQVRVNEDAPMPFIQMLMAQRSGDTVMADRYASTWVKYQQNFFFEVRQLTEIIGRALIREKIIDEEDWNGMPQYLNYEMAKTRQETNDLFRPTQEAAMRMIKPDERNQADVYYFFRFDCSYCRVMAPDVERLYRVFKYDRNVKMVGMELEKKPESWMKEYRQYTGLTLPVLDGNELAKAFNVKAAPAIVIVAPNGKRAYLKTGQQSFASMYQFVRTVQGLPAEMTPEVQQFAEMKIGEIENATFNPGKNLSVWLTDENERKEVERRLNRSKPKVQRVAARKTVAAAPPKKKATLEKF